MIDIEALVERTLRSDDVFRSAPSQDVIDLGRSAPEAIRLLELKIRAGLKQPQALRALVAMGHCTRHAPVEDSVSLVDLFIEVSGDRRLAVRSRAVHMAIWVLRVNRSRAAYHGLDIDAALVRVQLAVEAARAQGLDAQTDELVCSFRTAPWE